MKLKFEITPNRRLLFAFLLGCFQAGICYMFIMDWHGKEAYLALMQERWTDMHWGWWFVPWIVTLWLYARNVSNFDKETLWMTIKNPAKATREEGTDRFGQPLVRPNAPPPMGGPGNRPKPPPKPPGRHIKEGEQPKKPHYTFRPDSWPPKPPAPPGRKIKEGEQPKKPHYTFRPDSWPPKKP